MSDERFDADLRAFLRWQAADVAGAPTALEVVAAVAGTAGMHRRSVMPVRVLVAAGLIVAMLLAAVAIGARLTRPPVSRNGEILAPGPGCSLVAVDPTTQRRSAVVPSLSSCLSGDVSGYSFDALAASGEGRFVAYSRGNVCGACVSTPTAAVLEEQGLYLVDRSSDAMTKLDGCGGERCWWPLVAVNRDGSRIAWQRDLESGAAPRLFILERSSGRVSEVPEGAGGLAQLAWSPDGRRLAVVRSADVATVDGGFIIDADGRDRVVLPATPDPVTSLAWSPGGDTIVRTTVTQGDPTRPSIASVDVIDAGNGRLLLHRTLSGEASVAILSPGASRMIVVGPPRTGQGPTLRVDPVAGDSGTPLPDPAATLDPAGTVDVLNWPIWSPDGEDLAVSYIAESSQSDEHTVTYLVHLDGRAAEVIASTGPITIGAPGIPIAWLPAAPDSPALSR